MRVKTIRQW